MRCAKIGAAASEARPHGADAFDNAEGETSVGAIASIRMARRGRRTWHVQTLFVREPGDLAFGRLKNQQARIGKARSRSR
jgi:hypothetical protein